jgi:hypothetical protein
LYAVSVKAGTSCDDDIVATNSLPSSARLLPDLQRIEAMRQGDAPALSSPAARRIPLARHQVFTIKQSDGLRSLKVLRGTIWLTATPGNQDVLLSAQDHFALGPNAPFILEAMADAEVILFR